MKKNILYIFFGLLVISCGTSKQLTLSNMPLDSAKKYHLKKDDKRLFTYYFYEALGYKENEELDKAAELFQFCLALDSLDAGLQSEVGILYYSSGSLAQAAYHFEKAARLAPENWWHNMRVINVLAEQKKTTEAIEAAKELKKYFPEKTDTYIIISKLYKEAKEYDKAIDALNDLENLTGIEEETSLEKFQLYVLGGKSRKGITEIDRLIQKYPGKTQYKVLRGDIYMQQGMKDKALQTYEQVLKEDPQNANVYLSLSEYYNETNEPEKATEQIVIALSKEDLDVNTKVSLLGTYVQKLLQDTAKLDRTEGLFKMLTDKYPMEEQVHGYYALFLQYRKRNTEAIAELETMANINSKNTQPWVNIIQIYLSDRNYQKIIETTNKAINTNPGASIWYYYKGLAESQLNEYANAIITLKKGINFVDGNQNDVMSDFYAQIADCNWHLNQKDTAYIYYEKAISKNPKSLMVLNNYAYYLSLEKKDLSKAERMSAKTVELDPKNSTFLDTYAWILYTQRNYSLAKFYIERAIENLPKNDDHSVVYEHAGDIFWMYGKENKIYEEKAVEMWKKASEGTIKSKELNEKIEKKGWVRE